MKNLLNYVQKHLQELNTAEFDNLLDLVLSENLRRKRI